jgi:transcriptional regulator with XRE-family HTH domain
MTPFGLKVRSMREKRGITLKEMATALELSPAYLSALEHGRRGKPSRTHVFRVCAYFNIIWDEAEELERLAAVSHPRVTVDTAGLGAEATELANRLAQSIRKLPKEKIARLLAELRDEPAK